MAKSFLAAVIMCLGLPAMGNAAMKLKSIAFEHKTEIPVRFTCEGQNASPPLAWEGVPSAAKNLALIVYDPDAPDPAHPTMTWVHWILFNIPTTTDHLDAGTAALPTGASAGLNDWEQTSYGGPCPPIGRHRYVFKLFALDTVINLRKPKKKDLEKAMAGHIVAETELIGTYAKRSAH